METKGKYMFDAKYSFSEKMHVISKNTSNILKFFPVYPNLHHLDNLSNEKDLVIKKKNKQDNKKWTFNHKKSSISSSWNILSQTFSGFQLTYFTQFKKFLFLFWIQIIESLFWIQILSL